MTKPISVPLPAGNCYDPPDIALTAVFDFLNILFERQG